MRRRLSRRERTVIVGGTAVATAALLLTFVALPLLRRWSEREAGIAITAEQARRLEELVAGESAARATVARFDSRRAQIMGALLDGGTPAVAASNLQSLLARYANESRVLLERVDVVGTVDAGADTLVSIPARLAARSDIYGLVDLLSYVQRGEKLLVVSDLRVTSGRGVQDRSPLLSWTVTVRGYYARSGDS